MIIECVNCKAQLPVPDSSFKFGPISVTCPRCKTVFKPQVNGSAKKPAADLNDSNNIEDGMAGWLVVNDEKTHLQTFNLKAGRQLIGRKSESRPCDIMVDTADNFMSRNHFFIEARSFGDGYMCILSDNSSLNKTYINTTALRMLKKDDEYILRDGDIIQAGETKIVFKSKTDRVNNASEATRIVSGQSKGKTVLVNINS